MHRALSLDTRAPGRHLLTPMLGAVSRTCVAAALSALVALSVARPHVHEAAAAAHEGARCAVCQLRATEPGAGPVPDLAPRVVSATDLVLPPGLPPVSGAPIGAVPGQSPPHAA